MFRVRTSKRQRHDEGARRKTGRYGGVIFRVRNIQSTTVVDNETRRWPVEVVVISTCVAGAAFPHRTDQISENPIK